MVSLVYCIGDTKLSSTTLFSTKCDSSGNWKTFLVVACLRGMLLLIPRVSVTYHKMLSLAPNTHCGDDRLIYLSKNWPGAINQRRNFYTTLWRCRDIQHFIIIKVSHCQDFGFVHWGHLMFLHFCSSDITCSCCLSCVYRPVLLHPEVFLPFYSPFDHFLAASRGIKIRLFLS